jgi:hypothetical protein
VERTSVGLRTLRRALLPGVRAACRRKVVVDACHWLEKAWAQAPKPPELERDMEEAMHMLANLQPFG